MIVDARGSQGPRHGYCDLNKTLVKRDLNSART